MSEHRCDTCAHWKIKDVTRYEDGSEIVTRESPGNGLRGLCLKLNQQTEADFGCVKYENDEWSGHVRVTQKTGAPWQHFVMIPCVACQGGANCAGNCRCAGTGKVRKYDDGYIGEEQTRMHPKEKELGLIQPPKCRSCGFGIDAAWVMCPKCGTRIAPAETEVIEGLGTAGVAIDPIAGA